MNVGKLRKMAERHWRQDYREDMSSLSEARVITGNPHNDLFFHHMLIDHGVELVFKEEINQQTLNKQWRLVDYRVVDEKKYMMFVLRWS